MPLEASTIPFPPKPWYLPTEAAFAQGGYEVTPGSTHYAPGAAERLAASALTQLATGSPFGKGRPIAG